VRDVDFRYNTLRLTGEQTDLEPAIVVSIGGTGIGAPTYWAR